MHLVASLFFDAVATNRYMVAANTKANATVATMTFGLHVIFIS